MCPLSHFIPSQPFQHGLVRGPLLRQEAGTAWHAELGRLHALMTCLESTSCINETLAGLVQVGRPVLSSMAKGSDAKRQYKLRRLADAWRYGSGSDFKL